jgi:methylase of polypeptide subunit release factors
MYLPASILTSMTGVDTLQLRKERGAFFTPIAIAQHLADWALRGQGNTGTVLDPSCGDGVFLVAADERLKTEGRSGLLMGVDIHEASLNQTRLNLSENGADSELNLFLGDFFNELTPGQIGARLPYVDAVIGNPPFIRFQGHTGSSRRSATAAALAQGVRISGLASSWAPLLVHSSAFLKPDGRIAMVLPAELLSVGYAEPIRQWLKLRFRSVHLVLFEELQFEGADEQVVLLVARGSGGCNAFTLHYVTDADELENLHIYDAEAFAPRAAGKWTDLLIPEDARGVLRSITDDFFVSLSEYGSTELGTVTGANSFFTLSDATKRTFKLQEGRHVQRCVPPGTKHLRGLHFTEGQWEQAKIDGLRVWMLQPTADKPSENLAAYLKVGEKLGVPEAYKCSVRNPWWRPPMVDPPDLFVTYMSHIAPRLITNDCGVTFVNSMHGVTLLKRDQRWIKQALPVIALNSVSMLGAEMVGRAYGGGVLKLEPSEAAAMPLPNLEAMRKAWEILKPRRSNINELIRVGKWDSASVEVDEALLSSVLGIDRRKQDVVRAALHKIRRRRTGRGEVG